MEHQDNGADAGADRTSPEVDEKSGQAASDPGLGAAEKPEAETLREQLKEQQNKYLYLYAEFENYKKRAIKERSDHLKYGHEGFARELLMVSDNLERALEHTTNLDALVTGLKMVSQQLRDGLGKFGVTPISALGQKFDPERHEAVGQEKITAHSEVKDEGLVLRELQKGYALHGRLLRPARVVVASK